MNKTNISWCDYTWNPVAGCTKISEGCDNCYAHAIANRFGWSMTPTLHEDRLTQPGKVKQPSRVFISSMGDLFHADNLAMPGLIDLVMAQTEVYDWHTYIVLTKRPELALRWTQETELEWSGGWPSNVWFLFSAENQRWFDERIEPALKIPSVIHGVSLEPLLGPISCDGYLDKLDWTIAGPETGPNRRECKPEWIFDLAGTKSVFFDKREKWIRREWPLNRERRYGNVRDMMQGYLPNKTPPTDESSASKSSPHLSISAGVIIHPRTATLSP